MLKIPFQRSEEILNSAKNKKIAVIGDLMLDEYYWGSVTRVSPEAPVPVIDIESESIHLGGAANVGSNLSSLGIEPILFGVLGNDKGANIFNEIAEKAGINTEYIFKDDHRPTTIKTRIIGNNQQIARLDREVKSKISSHAESHILKAIRSIKDLSGVIFEDYNKGVINPGIIREITQYCNKKDIPIYVDPKMDNFFDYKHCTLFKPNKKEASQALNHTLKTKEDILHAGKRLLEELNCKNILLTLGADGMMLFESNGNVSSVPTIALKVADVSGAGDTAIATLSAAMSGGASVVEAAIMANLAAGYVCELPGIVSISANELLEVVKANNHLE